MTDHERAVVDAARAWLMAQDRVWETRWGVDFSAALPAKEALEQATMALRRATVGMLDAESALGKLAGSLEKVAEQKGATAVEH